MTRSDQENLRERGFDAGREESEESAVELQAIRAAMGAVAYEMGCLTRAAERARDRDRDRDRDLLGGFDHHARDQAIHFGQLAEIFRKLAGKPDREDFELDPPPG